LHCESSVAGIENRQPAQAIEGTPICANHCRTAGSPSTNGALHAIEYFGRLRPRQYYRYPLWSLRTDNFVKKGQIYFQDFFVEKKKRAKSLILGGRRDLAANSEIGEEGLNLGGTKIPRWSITLVLYESLDPLYVGNFGSITIMMGTKHVSRLFHESLRHATKHPFSQTTYHPSHTAYIGH
jgi:hypothetical protein